MNRASRGREIFPFASRSCGWVLVLSGGAERKEALPPKDKDKAAPPEKDVAPVPPPDPIDEAEIDSFPASDPPSHTPVHGTGPAPGG